MIWESTLSTGPSYNAGLDRVDIDSEAVNLAARLEPLAELGEVLVAEEFGGFVYSDPAIVLSPCRVKLQKGWQEYKSGDMLQAFKLSYLKN